MRKQTCWHFSKMVATWLEARQRLLDMEGPQNSYNWGIDGHPCATQEFNAHNTVPHLRRAYKSVYHAQTQHLSTISWGAFGLHGKQPQP